MCRAPTVLSADRCKSTTLVHSCLLETSDACILYVANVDWALLNFMKDWFPAEARKKLHQNEREAAEEEMQELGLEYRGCVVM